MDQSTGQFDDLRKVPACIESALRELNRAWHYAAQCQRSCWDFAVELEEFESRGLTRSDFSWLVANGLVDHQCEVTGENDDARSFEACGKQTFPSRTCFVLTQKGIAAVRGLDGIQNKSRDGKSIRIDLSHEANDTISPQHNYSPALVAAMAKQPAPHWDCESLTLTVDELIIKRIKRRAKNQIAILECFEEEGWPHRISDPIRPSTDQGPKRSLNDTIKYLNQNHENQVIRFRGDGTGEGIIWEFIILQQPALHVIQ